MKNSLTWRYIPPIEAPGWVQMALDTWLLTQHQQGTQPSTLRFYTWSAIAISLGYHQHHYPQHWHDLTWEGQPIELVRRPSGGRAVLHQGDLTYAVITSQLPGTRLQAYQHICEFLIQGWRSLGVDLHYGQAGRGYIHNPNCFGTATGADLVTTDGMKLIGSAQLRRDNVLLQHGSMQLTPNPALFHQVFGIKIHPSTRLAELAQDRMGSITDALLTAAQQWFQAELIPQPLSDAEWADVLSFSSNPMKSALIPNQRQN